LGQLVTSKFVVHITSFMRWFRKAFLGLVIWTRGELPWAYHQTL